VSIARKTETTETAWGDTWGIDMADAKIATRNTLKVVPVKFGVKLCISLPLTLATNTHHWPKNTQLQPPNMLLPALPPTPHCLSLSLSSLAHQHHQQRQRNIYRSERWQYKAEKYIFIYIYLGV
jgi:hypothetical protein